jgi:hypothetical protein
LRRLQVTLSAAKLGARVKAVHEKDRAGGICLCIHRREDQGTWGLARAEARDAGREIVHQVAPEIVEERKRVKPTSPVTPVFSHGGIVCAGKTFKNVVKMTFASGEGGIRSLCRY